MHGIVMSEHWAGVNWGNRTGIPQSDCLNSSWIGKRSKKIAKYTEARSYQSLFNKDQLIVQTLYLFTFILFKRIKEKVGETCNFNHWANENFLAKHITTVNLFGRDNISPSLNRAFAARQPFFHVLAPPKRRVEKRNDEMEHPVKLTGDTSPINSNKR